MAPSFSLCWLLPLKERPPRAKALAALPENSRHNNLVISNNHVSLIILYFTRIKKRLRWDIGCSWGQEPGDGRLTPLSLERSRYPHCLTVSSLDPTPTFYPLGILSDLCSHVSREYSNDWKLDCPGFRPWTWTPQNTMQLSECGATVGDELPKRMPFISWCFLKKKKFSSTPTPTSSIHGGFLGTGRVNEDA